MNEFSDSDSKQTFKNIISNVSRSATWFLFFGLMAIVVSSGLDILFGKEISHPIWQNGYNWMPLVESIFVTSIAGGGILAIVPRLLYAYRHRSEKPKKLYLLKPINLPTGE